MAKRKGLDWKGDEVRRRAHAAARRGIDATTAACVLGAKSSHPWQNRTGTLEGSLQMRPAVAVGPAIMGRWGSFDVNYALWLEVRWAGRYRYLLPQADQQYPLLAGRIRQALR